MQPYKPTLKPFSRSLRINMTDAEQMLWSKLRRKQILGVQFYRQKPLMGYIVDFYSAAAKLVIELDGSQHLEPAHQAADIQRDQDVKALGLLVLRFDNLQVLKELDVVMSVIFKVVEKQMQNQIPPSPPFSKGGEPMSTIIHKVPPFEKGGRRGDLKAGLGGIKLLTDHLDIWTAADTEKKSGRGRSSGNAASVYGIKKLRELILELAVRGKLVPQDANDEPASELLKRIAAEKARLIAKGKIKKGKPLPSIIEDEKLFELPHGWEWVRLGTLGEWGAGATPARSNSKYYGGDIPWFKSGELSADYISQSEETVTELALKECSLRANSVGDVLIAMYGATIGKTAILSVPATTNQAVCACTPFNGIANRYLLLLLKALKPNFIGQGAGGAQPNISREKIIATITALPPLEEQHRIVAKVDELMALCDQLEQQQTHSIAGHQTLVASLLGTLTKSPHPPLCQRGDGAAGGDLDWARIASHFDTLFTTEASIAQLKQTILQLAVMGKLVPQDLSDEPASALLKRIHSEKSKLVAEGKIKKGKLLPPITDQEKPFDLPKGWEWVRLDELARLITKGSSPKWQGVSYTDNPDDVMFVTSENVGSYSLLLDSPKYVEKKFNEIEPRSILAAGDFLMNIVGASIGRTAVYNIDTLANINQAVCLIRITTSNLLSMFLLHFFNSETCLGYMFDKQVDNARPNLSMGNIAKFLIPIPPIAEQRRIVAKVDELMALCDTLKARLADAQAIQLHLADAIVEQAAC